MGQILCDIHGIKDLHHRIVRSLFDMEIVTLCLAVLVACISGSPTHAQSSDNTRSKPANELNNPRVLLPGSLTANVLNHEGEPIANATIRGDLNVYKPNKLDEFRPNATKIERTSTSDAQGRFSIDTADIHVFRKEGFSFFGTVEAEGYPRLLYRFKFKNITERIQIEDARLVHGRRIVGQISTTAPYVMAPSNPTVKIRCEAGDENDLWWTSPTISCDEEGNFEAFVPAERHIEILAAADNLVRETIILDPDKAETGIINLEKGTVVFGRVLDLNGEPVAGTIVTSSQSGHRLLSGWRFHPTSVKTDQTGSFRFPPQRGQCRINIAEQGTQLGSDESLVADGKMPLVTPHVIDLDGQSDEFEIEIVEADSVSISGTVRWSDGESVPNVVVRVSIFAGHCGTAVESTITNELGQYTVRSVARNEKAMIHVAPAMHESGNLFYAHATEPTIDKVNRGKQKMSGGDRQPASQYLYFGKFKGDLTDIDWVMKPEK